MHDALTWPVGRAAHDPRSDAQPAPAPPVLAYVTATLLAGIAVAAAIGAAAGAARDGLGVSPQAVLAVAAPVALLAAACQLAGRMRPFPERRAQVPTRWLQWRHRTLTAAAFGLMIGGGATYLRHATAWILVLLLVAAPSVTAAAACGAAYGAARGLPLLVTWIADRVARRRPPWERLGARSAPLSLLLAPLALVTYVSVLALSLA